MDRAPRDVKHGAEFDVSWRELNLDPHHLADLLLAVNWLISRTAEDCFVDSTGLRHYANGPSENFPALTFYFTIDDEQTCTLRYVRRA